MAAFVSAPWPWYVAGPALGLFVPALLIIGNRQSHHRDDRRHRLRTSWDLPVRLPEAAPSALIGL